MVNSLQKKYFHPFMAALLVLTVICPLIFLKTEMPNTFGMAGGKPYSKSAFAPFGNTVYWLAEETSMNKAKKNSSSVMLNGAPLVLMPVEIQSVAGCFILLLTKHIYYHNINNAVLLKLRI
jgi:hypothetical protein